MMNRIEINLLPVEYRVRPKNIRLDREIVWPLVGTLVLLTIMAIVVANVNGEIDGFEGRIDSVERDIEKNRVIAKEIKHLETSRETVISKIQALQRINVSRGKWVRIPEILSRELPERTWLVGVSENGKRLQVNGQTMSFPEVAGYMARLSATDLISGVELLMIEQTATSNKVPQSKQGRNPLLSSQASIRKRASPDDETFDFVLLCKLNQDPEGMVREMREQTAGVN